MPDKLNDALDEQSAMSFPASDPPAHMGSVLVTGCAAGKSAATRTASPRVLSKGRPRVRSRPSQAAPTITERYRRKPTV